jgi:hypothetical protein
MDTTANLLSSNFLGLSEVPSNDTTEQVHNPSVSPIVIESNGPMGNNPLSGLGNTFSSQVQQTEATPTTQVRFPETLTKKYEASPIYNVNMDPFADNETLAAKHWSNWDAVKTGLSGMLDNTLYAGKEYANSWLRIGRALLTLDPNALVPTELENQTSALEQSNISMKNPIYYDPNSENDIFSRQFLSEAIQNTGFTLGTMGAFLGESYAFGKLGTLTESLPKLFKAGASSALNTADETLAAGGKIQRLYNKERAFSETIDNLITNGPAGQLGGKSLFDSALDIASKLPFVDALADAGKIMKAGSQLELTTGELMRLGAGGVRRMASEWNFAASEAAVEAGGVYGDTYNDLYKKYKDEFGVEPEGSALETIRNSAMNAATKDYGVNIGILGITEKIAFGNMFRAFNIDNTFTSLLRNEASNVISVMGKDVGGDLLRKEYSRGFLGILGHAKDISTTFGRETMYKEVGKDLIRGASKFELNEGIQENLQNITANSLKNYYGSLYDKDLRSWGDSFKEGVDAEISSQGWKTFLQGAMVGFFIAPITNTLTRSVEKIQEIKAQKANPNHVTALQSTLDNLNTFYKDPQKILFDPIRKAKEQLTYNNAMAVSASKGNKYEYFNNKDSALIKLAMDAKRTGTFDGFIKFIKSYGTEFTEKEFKEATGIDLKKAGYNSPQDFVSKIGEQLERYADIYDKHMDRFNDYFSIETLASDPYRKQRFSFAQMAMQNAVQIAAFNESKAEASTMRAADIMRNIASKAKSIGQAASSSFNVISSYDRADEQIKILENELKNLKEVTDKDASTKALIKLKEQELDHLMQWNAEAYTETKDSKDPSSTKYIPLNQKALTAQKKDRLANILTNYYSVKNQQMNNHDPIQQDHVRRALKDINDYQKLSQDTHDYIAAVNLLSDPKNMIKVAQAHQDALVAAYARIAHDIYAKGLAQQSEIFAEYIKENPQDMDTLLKIARSPFASSDTIETVFKAIDNINSLSQKQGERDAQNLQNKIEELAKKKEEFEFNLKAAAGVNLLAMKPADAKNYRHDHYDLVDYTEGTDLLEDGDLIRSFQDFNGKTVTTHKIPISALIEHFKRITGEDIAGVDDDQIVQFINEFETELFYKENPGVARVPGQPIERKKAKVDLAKKLVNLVDQRVLVNGKKGTIAIQNGKYVIEFEDDTEQIIGPVGRNEISYQWSYDRQSSDYVLVPSIIETSIDDYPHITLLSEGLTDKEKEIIGATVKSEIFRVNDESYNVEYNDPSNIKINGIEYEVVRENNLVQSLTDKEDGDFSFTVDDAALDPNGLAASMIELANTIILQKTGVNLTEEQIDNALAVAGEAESDTVGKKAKTAIQARNIDTLTDADIIKRAEDILLPSSEDVAKLLDYFIIPEERVNLKEEDLQTIWDWAIDAVKRLNLLDPNASPVINKISLLNDIFITPLHKEHGFTSDSKQPKKAVSKETTTTGKTEITQPQSDAPSAPSKYKGKSIEEAGEYVDKQHKKKDKERAVKLEELTKSSNLNLFTAQNIEDAKTAAPISKTSYKTNTKVKVEKDPFEDDSLLSDFNCNI